MLDNGVGDGCVGGCRACESNTVPIRVVAELVAQCSVSAHRREAPCGVIAVLEDRGCVARGLREPCDSAQQIVVVASAEYWVPCVANGERTQLPCRSVALRRGHTRDRRPRQKSVRRVPGEREPVRRGEKPVGIVTEAHRVPAVYTLTHRAEV